jgi:serine protease Do
MSKLFPNLTLAGLTSFICLTFMAAPAVQAQDKKTDKLGEYDEIIIKRKGDKDGKVTVEIRDGEAWVDGQKLENYKDGDITVYRRRIRPVDGNAFGFNTPPHGSLQLFDDEGEAGPDAGITPNKAMLGVITEKKEAAGATVKIVDKSSPAEKAGLQPGDVITAVDADKISEPKDLYEKIGAFEPGDKVTITYLRNNKESKATVTLDERKGGAFNMRPRRESGPAFRVPRGRLFDNLFGDEGGSRLGLSVQDTENQEGAVVLEVAEGSAASKAGFRQNDIITSMAGSKVSSARDVVDTYQDNKDKGTITAKVKRGNKEETIEIKVPRKLNKADL